MGFKFVKIIKACFRDATYPTRFHVQSTKTQINLRIRTGWSVFAVRSLRKHACSNILRILQPKKNENFQRKNSDIFHIPAQNIDCGYSLEQPRRGGSKEYPQSMFLSINKKSNVYQCKHQFYCIKVGFKAVKIILACFRDVKTFKIQFYPQITLRKLYSDCANAHSV